MVGSVNVDLTVRCGRLPAPGETVVGGELARGGGGKGANQAVAAARAGAAVRLVGAVGDDDLGREALADLRAEGVDVEGVCVVSGVATGAALIVVDHEGRNQIAVASGANHAIDGGAVRRATHAGGGCLLVSFELTDDVVLAAAEAACADGAALIVNPAPARSLLPRLCELSPILTPNEGEVFDLTGASDPKAAAARLAARTGAPVIVTLGARGALAVDGSDTFTIPAGAVRAVDTTGAGDVFNGVLACELARGTALQPAVEAAVAAASRSVTTVGARGTSDR